MPNDFENQKNYGNTDKGRFGAQATIQEGQEKIKKTAEQMEQGLKEGKEQVSQWVDKVDQQLHSNPWPIVVGVGVVCLLLGAILGSKK